MQADLIALPTLSFPSISVRLQTEEGIVRIYDEVRKQYVNLTPEEWVRQHCLHWLVTKGYPMGRCSVERRLDKTGMRYDLLWVDDAMRPFLLVECKAPSIRITQDTLRQSSWYNLTLKAPHIVLTNGRETFCASIGRDGGPVFEDDIPTYPPTA